MWVVQARHHPAGRALQDGQLGRQLLDLGNELRRRRAGPDHADALTAQVMVVIPACRVKARALEVGKPRNVGVVRLDQPAGGSDEPTILLEISSLKFLWTPSPL